MIMHGHHSSQQRKFGLAKLAGYNIIGTILVEKL
jgi:hypothetical protein